MRPDAAVWEDEYSGRLINEGSHLGLAAPTVFVKRQTGVRLVVWGDDFTFLGRDCHLKDASKAVAGWYDIKVRAVLSPRARRRQGNEDFEPRAEVGHGRHHVRRGREARGHFRGRAKVRPEHQGVRRATAPIVRRSQGRGRGVGSRDGAVVSAPGGDHQFHFYVPTGPAVHCERLGQDNGKADGPRATPGI